jgi:nitroimidazol reductase NimA-like FMN-containing flavoprotein (pyridoxamine 5'-phosphate oxidase superfamily)
VVCGVRADQALEGPARNGTGGTTMFREMRRFKQQVSEAECIEILKSTKRGVLSVIGDDGYPYGMPLNHYYCEEDGKLYFHGAKAGHKIDAIKACDKVSYCVYDDGFRREGEWALNITSVIIFGRIHLVEDKERALKICSELTRKFTDDEAYLEKEIANFFRNVQCLELVPEHMTGKLVNES